MNMYNKIAIVSSLFVAPLTFVTHGQVAEQAPLVATNSIVPPQLGATNSTIWDNGVGSGFRSSAQSFTVEAGAAGGIACFGGQQAHDLGLLSASYGHMLSGVVGQGHWYRGNLEGRVELFGGMQFRPEDDTDGW